MLAVAPVIVVGHVYTSEYGNRNGLRRSSLEMQATSVGPDLSRVTVRIENAWIHRSARVFESHSLRRCYPNSLTIQPPNPAGDAAIRLDALPM